MKGSTEARLQLGAFNGCASYFYSCWACERTSDLCDSWAMSWCSQRHEKQLFWLRLGRAALGRKTSS